MNFIFKKLFLFLLILFFVATACDKLTQDELNPKNPSKVIVIQATTKIGAFVDMQDVLRSNEPITYSIPTQPTRGVLSMYGGSFLYFQPNPSATVGQEKLSMQVGNQTYELQLTIADNTPCEPVAELDLLDVKLNTATNLDVLKNDPIACNGNLVTLAIAIAPQSGVASVTGQKLTYTPKPDFRGADKFLYKVSDTRTGAIAFASVIVSVGQETNPPCVFTVVDDYLSTAINSEGTINPVSNDRTCPADTGQARISVAINPKHGSVRFSNVGLTLYYLPEKNYLGKDSLYLKVCDPSGGCLQSKLNIIVTPPKGGENPPNTGGACNFIVNDDQLTTQLNFESGINPAANDDICVSPGNRIVLTTANPPKNGKVRFENNDLSLFYMPNTNFIGLDSMTINVCRAPNDCKSSKVSIRVIRK